MAGLVARSVACEPYAASQRWTDRHRFGRHGNRNAVERLRLHTVARAGLDRYAVLIDVGAARGSTGTHMNTTARVPPATLSRSAPPAGAMPGRDTA